MALAAGVAVAREDGEEPGAGEAVTDLHQVTADTGIDAMPSWTPDGRRIVFHARHAPEKAGLLPTRKIWVVDREGHDARLRFRGKRLPRHLGDGRRRQEPVAPHRRPRSRRASHLVSRRQADRLR